MAHFLRSRVCDQDDDATVTGALATAVLYMVAQTRSADLDQFVTQNINGQSKTLST